MKRIYIRANSHFVYQLAWIVCIWPYLLACEVKTAKDAGYNMQDVRQELELRKAKRITSQQFLSWVDEQGGQMVVLLNQLLSRHISDSAMLKQTLPTLLQSSIDSLEQTFGCRITYVWVDEFARQQAQSTDSKIRQLWEAYLYDIEQKRPLQINIQYISTQENYLYTAPIILYDRKPIDTTAFGLWVITFPRKEIVRRF